MAKKLGLLVALFRAQAKIPLANEMLQFNTREFSRDFHILTLTTQIEHCSKSLPNHFRGRAIQVDSMNELSI